MAEDPKNEAPAPEQPSRKQSVFQITLDHETQAVTLGGTPLPIHVAQMLVDEAGRQLAHLRLMWNADQARRQALAQAEAAKRTADILGRVSSTMRKS